jgi:hypothetical protein
MGRAIACPMHLPRTLLACALAWCATGCAEPDEATRPSRAACTEVRAHVVDLQLVDHADEHLDQHRQNFVAAMGEAYLDECVAERSPAYVACVLAARTPQAADGCR